MKNPVMPSAYAGYMDVIKHIDALLQAKPTVTVAIDGGSASGKTTLAGLLSEVYDCNVFHMDDFFLPPERKTPERLSEPGGNVDYERFAEEVAAGLKSGDSFTYRPYGCKTGSYKDAVTVFPKALNIVEGVYSLHPVISKLYDMKLFLKTDEIAQIERIRKRSGEALLKRFVNEWIPLEKTYFEALDIEQSCDFVFDTTNTAHAQLTAISS
jgi:uridine kinase